MAINQFDPVTSLMNRLEQELGQAQDQSLTFEAWRNLYNDESSFEDILIQQADALQKAGELAAAGHMLTTVAELNDRLASVADVLCDHPPDTGYDAEKLAQVAEQRDEAADFGISTRAQGLMLIGAAQRLSSDFNQSEDSYREAGKLFRRSHSDLGPIMALLADGNALGSAAAAQQLRFQLEDASITFLQGKKALEKALSQFQELPDPDKSLLSEINNAINTLGMSRENALFVNAVNDGNFNDAAKRAQAMLEYYAQQDDLALPPLARQMNEFTRGNLKAYAAYARAEIALSHRDWDKAQERLTEAEDNWQQAIDAAMNLEIPQSRQLAEATQAVSAQVLGGFRRRISHEQRLFQRIDSLEQQVAGLNAEMLKLAGKPTHQGDITVTDQHSSYSARDVAGGDIVKGVKAGNVQGDLTTGDKFTGIKAGGNVTAGDMNFSKAWQEHASEIDLPALADQLNELYAQLEALDGGEHDTQIAAVAAAQKAAAKGDGPKALKWLKSAGDWALEHAKDIFPIAVAAIKIALGVPV